MSELLRDIEDDIRRERYDRLWHSFGKVMVGVSLLVILVTIAVVIWQNHTRTHAMEKTSQFIKGIDRLNIEDYKGAIAVFDALSEDSSSRYYPLAQLRRAQAQFALSDHDGAYATYRSLSERDPVFGALAGLMLPVTAQDLASPRPGSAFFYTQSEARAWQLLKLDRKEEAVVQFLALYHDSDTPYSMRSRVGEALQYLAPERLRMEDGGQEPEAVKHAE